MSKIKYDWYLIAQRLIDLIESGEVKNKRQAATALDIPRSSLTGFLARNKADGVENFFKIPELLNMGALEKAGIPRPGLHEEKSENTWDITSSGANIKTLDELIEFCKIDLKIWSVERHVINKWSYGVRDGTVYPLFQVKAWLVRIKPIALMPPLSRISIKLPNKRKVTKKKSGSMRKALIWADPQFGFRRNIYQVNKLEAFHDRRVLDLIMQVLEMEKFDVVACLGDLLDQNEFTTKFIQERGFWNTTQATIIESGWWLGKMRKAQPNAEFYTVEGNHNRINTAIQTYMPAVYGLHANQLEDKGPVLSMRFLIGLDDMDIEFIQGYQQAKARKFLSDTFVLEHGQVAVATPGATARKVSQSTIFTTMIGHIHRRETVTQKLETHEGEHVTYSVVCPGCVCRIDAAVPGNKLPQNWQQGFAVAYYDVDHPEVEPEINVIAVDNGKAIYNGKLLEAQNMDTEAEKIINEALAIIEENMKGY